VNKQPDTQLSNIDIGIVAFSHVENQERIVIDSV
jgi:hypothetical protein